MWKTIFITGPTTSGKSDLAIYLAKKLQGEIINADSKQVYKYLDVGSGKVSKKETKGIFHYLLSIAHPKKNYSLGRWLKDAHKAVKKIIKKGKVPIFCGGTILYLRGVKEGWVLPSVKPNYKLRKELEKRDNEELYKEIKKLDPQRAKNLDPRNKRRLIRALEIIYTLGKVPKIKKEPKYEVLIIAPKFWDDTRINTDSIYPNNRPNKLHESSDRIFGHNSDKVFGQDSGNLGLRESALNTLSARIKRRLIKRVPGIIKEIKKLRRLGLSYKRIISFGLEYKWFGLYAEQADLTQKRQKNSAKSALYSAKSECYKDILRFAKRQIRELRKIEEVVYVKDKKSAAKVVENFLKNNL
jgi:tRNA dimethylallyltransferase